MNHIVVIAGVILGMSGGTRPGASILTGVGWGGPDEWRVVVPEVDVTQTYTVAMPEVRMDEYPAVRLEHHSTNAPGVILNALTGEIIREGVTLWSGAAAPQPVDPERFRQFVEQARVNKLWSEYLAEVQRERREFPTGPISVIRNSVCDEHGEVYGRVLESVSVITPAEGR